MIVDVVTTACCDNPVAAVLLLLVVPLATWYYLYLQNRDLPPGPWGIPILGYLPFLGDGRETPTEVVFHRLCQKYKSNVISIKMGPRFIVVLDNFAAIKEAFIKQGDNFTARPDGLFIKTNENDEALGVVNGEPWKEHRRFAIATLRDFGMGKLSMEPRITEEIRFFLEELAKQKCEPFDFNHLLARSAVNIISSLEFGKRFDYKDERLTEVRRLQDELMELISTVPIRSFYPWIARLRILDWWTHESKIEKMRVELYDIFREMIAEHERNYVDNSRTDYVDAYLTERKAIVEKTGDEGHYTYHRLEGTLETLFIAGAETMKNTLRWAFMFLLYYPEVQDRLRREVDDVIGMERAPTMSDTIRMKYTEAFILEVHRYGAVSPLNIPHANLEETEIFGHRIPKMSVIMTNLWAVHFDPNLWDEPDKFNPERFFDENGEVHRPEFLMSFSMGKRACLGEGLARMELFLYLTSMLQRFTFLPPEGTTPTISYLSFLIRFPKPYKMCAVPRAGYHVL